MKNKVKEGETRLKSNTNFKRKKEQRVFRLYKDEEIKTENGRLM